MKTINLEDTTLDRAVDAAQLERMLITRNGKPVALIVGLEGIDAEQLQLGSSDTFWKLIAERRTHKTISRAQLEQKIKNKQAGTGQ